MSGLLLLCLPVLWTLTPAIVYPACAFVSKTIKSVFLLFCLEICREQGRSFTEVIPANYVVMAVSAMLAIGAFFALRPVLDTPLAWSLIALLGVAPTLVAIPTLPSRSSDAVVFTLPKLPEDEGYEDRSLRARDSLAAKYQLSDREKEVFDLLVRGATRKEIARDLSISIWTVKDHVDSIYEKTGAHSAKDLVLLVAGGKTG